jgi:two-component system OmpR family sensor kinase
MTAEECEHAFERFWRGTLDRSGSGLGLAIVAQLMAASGGSARLDPRPGGGVVATALFDSA